MALGKEWATPGVVAGLQRAVSGLDTGREAASPRVQARLRRIAEDLAVGVERVAPRLKEGPGRVVPKVSPKSYRVAAPPVAPAGRGGRKMWLLLGVVAALAAGALALLEILKGPGEPEAEGKAEDPGSEKTGVTDQGTIPARRD